MRIGAIAREVSAGAIVGLSAIIYSLSYGALLFSGGLTAYVGYGIAIALITAVVGAALGWFSEEKSFIIGPDSNTTSVLASVLAASGSLGLTASGPLHLAVATVVMTTAVTGLAFLAAAKSNVASLVRYIPFSVMAGFLASTGWLMSSGALNIIAGTPLTVAGVRAFLADPARPDLAFGILVTGVLLALSKRVSSAVLIPLVMLVAAIVVNVFLASGMCDGAHCGADSWLFSRTQEFRWLAPWEVRLGASELAFLAGKLPAVLVVSFVGLLTILLSVASLELSHQREFELNRVLRLHAVSAGLSAGLGGFVGIISIGRTTLNRQAGGGALAGTIAALICLGALLGGGAAIAYVPKAALGALVLFLGIGMLRQWLWDQRRKATPVELAQIVAILVLVAKFGFLVGFGAGILIACMVFVVTYSKIPIADLATNLSVYASTVVRPAHEVATLHAHGRSALLYRLSGYVFFGSASTIDSVFQTLDDHVEALVIDFTNVSGIDSSAIGVFQRILRRFSDKGTRFHFVYAPDNEASVRSIAPTTSRQIQFFAALDHAVEREEEEILARWGTPAGDVPMFAFLDGPDSRAAFLGHCERRQLKRGELLCAEGDHSNELFFIESGSLEVIKSHDGGAPVRLAKLRAGAMVGEVAFYTGAARTASIAASDDSRVYVLHRDDLTALRSSHPALATTFDHMVIGKLSRALTRTTELLAL